MKIGVSCYSFYKHMEQTGANYFEVCDLAKKYGYDGIEFIDLDLRFQHADNISELARSIKKHCDEIGLEITAYTVRGDFLANPDELERLKGQVDVAELLGAKLLRHDITWQNPKDKTWKDIIDSVKDKVYELSSYAEKKGIRTCTENHGLHLQDAERIEYLIKTVNHKNYGWLVDMGNFLCADDPAVHAIPIAAPYAFHVHAKDFLYRYPWEENPGDGWFQSRNGSYLKGTVLGCGVVPLKWALETILKAGYKGWLSLEFEGMEECLPAIKAGYSYLNRFREHFEKIYN